MIRAVKLSVSGRVQGVGFRWMTKMVADKLGIKGTVANLSDGSVYIEAVGPEPQMSEFIGAIKASPSPSGRVDHFEIKPLSPFPDFKNFTVTA